jgi:Uncharacterised nucleotidyltransferase
LVIVLCLDLVKDIAQPWNFRLIKITDIAEALECSQGIDWAALIGRARYMGLSRVTYFGLLFADTVYGVSMPAEVRHQIEAQGGFLRPLVILALRAVLDQKSSTRMPSPQLLHEPRTIILLQDTMTNSLAVAGFYLMRPFYALLKYCYTATANFVGRKPIVGYGR